jgi:hypothetical protein
MLSGPILGLVAVANDWSPPWWHDDPGSYISYSEPYDCTDAATRSSARDLERLSGHHDAHPILLGRALPPAEGR